MKTVKLGINGFGRIGRLVARVALSTPNVELVMVNDPFMTADYAKYLFEYDSTHGIYDGKVSVKGDVLIIDGQKIKFSAEKEPTEIEWGKYNVDIVVEATGKFKDIETASAHIKSGAKKVLITAPSKDAPTIVLGVNDDTLKNTMKIVSNASCTTNCLAPVVKVLNDNFGVVEGLMSTIHATTATQLVVDGTSKKDWRGGRAASTNIIPSSTGAAKLIGVVIPELKGKLDGFAMRVPTPDVSLVDVVFETEKKVTVEEVNAALKAGADGHVLCYTEEPLVSSDYIGSSQSSTVDALLTRVMGDNMVKIISWYDNEMGYSTRLAETTKMVANKL